MYAIVIHFLPYCLFQCVKSLLYHINSINQAIDVNAANAQRDTPLHLASRWGYGK